MCMKAQLFMHVFLMLLKPLTWWVTRFSLAGCWTEIFLFSSSASLCHGTKTSTCASGGMALSKTISMSPMVSGKGVFSPPIVFTIYVYNLLEDLSMFGIGCYWDSPFAGSVCYADDLVLLGPSPSALRNMLRCREDFTTNRSLRINPSKTQLIRFSHSPFSSCSACIYFSGQFLPFLHRLTPRSPSSLWSQWHWGC